MSKKNSKGGEWKMALNGVITALKQRKKREKKREELEKRVRKLEKEVQELKK